MKGEGGKYWLVGNTWRQALKNLLVQGPEIICRNYCILLVGIECYEPRSLSGWLRRHEMEPRGVSPSSPTGSEALSLPKPSATTKEYTSS